MKSENYWLIKSEPTGYSIDDLERDGTTPWTGIRSYQSRNFMRDGMRKGDLILFYHSSTAVPGVVGIAKVASETYADPTQFNEHDYHYEPRATKETPVWHLVDISFVKKFKEVVPLMELRNYSELSSMALLRPRNRLSIMPIDQKQFEFIAALAQS